MISTEHPNKFRYVYGYYRYIRNLKYVIQHIDLAISSLQRCVYLDSLSEEVTQYYSIGRDILDRLLLSVGWSTLRSLVVRFY